MTIVEGQLIEVKWNNMNRKHYENKGYKFTKIRDVFKVKAEDLTSSAKVKIKVKCNYCNEISIKNRSTIKDINDYCCSNCKGKKIKKVKSTWTKNDIELLIEMYESEEWEVILNKLSHFKQSTIISKAMELGLSRRNKYTKEEIEIIKENYENSTLNEVKKLLPNRTKKSIQTKANRLGLVNKVKWSEKELEILKSNYSTLTNEELSIILPNRTISSIQTTAISLGLNKSKEEYNKHFSELMKNELSQKLTNFANKLGKTPTSDEINASHEMPGVVSYHRYFGSYSNACIENGLDVNSNIFGKSHHTLSLNGDVCLSKREKEITDIFIQNGINYKKEVLYKDIINKFDDSNIRCDWLINDIIVEYFGMPEKEYYRERMNEKIKICKENNIKLIQLFKKDLSYNYRGLIDKFKECGINLKIIQSIQ